MSLYYSIRRRETRSIKQSLDVDYHVQKLAGSGVGRHAVVKALVRSATGKRLNNRLPKLSLITLPPSLNSGILGLRMRPYVPTPKFFTTSGDPRRVIHQILDMRKYVFSLKSVFMVDVRFELTTNDPWSVDDAICEGISPLSYW